MKTLKRSLSKAQGPLRPYDCVSASARSPFGADGLCDACGGSGIHTYHTRVEGEGWRSDEGNAQLRGQRREKERGHFQESAPSQLEAQTRPAAWGGRGPRVCSASPPRLRTGHASYALLTRAQHPSL